MADCSKTEVFLKEWKRMCDAMQRTCQQCYLYEMVDTGSCHTAMQTMPNLVIDAVQKWSDEHPKKTRQSEFLKMFPNAVTEKIGEHKILAFCPIVIDVNLRCHSSSKLCADCRKEYWLAEVE